MALGWCLCSSATSSCMSGKVSAPPPSLPLPGAPRSPFAGRALAPRQSAKAPRTLGLLAHATCCRSRALQGALPAREKSFMEKNCLLEWSRPCISLSASITIANTTHQCQPCPHRLLRSLINSSPPLLLLLLLLLLPSRRAGSSSHVANYFPKILPKTLFFCSFFECFSKRASNFFL